MGGWSSKQWRDVPQNHDEILRFVKSYRPQMVNNLRILLHGPTGAGKSSFINSVESVVQGRVCGRALEDATSGSSFTKKFKTYQISKDPQNYCSFVFNDTMGLESGTGGVSIQDLTFALNGHVAEGYEFTSDHPLTERDISYVSSPSLAEKVHVLVFLVPADAVSLVSDEAVRKMREVRQAARDLDIPQMVVLTKVDMACPEVKKNTNNTYRSKLLKDKVDLFHQQLGIPLNCIFLIKNYSSEIETNHVMDAHLLLALKQIIMFGEDFLKNQQSVVGKHDHILDYVKSYRPQMVNNLRILLHGPAGGGKSSFINSVESVVQGRVCGRALVNAIPGSSFTKKFKTYQIRKDQGNYCSFVFNDTMGLEPGTGGVHVEDLKLALNGHVAEGYKFIPDRPLTRRDISSNSSPSLADKAHVVVFVIPADSLFQLNEDVVEKMKEIRCAASDMDIPQVVILTKIDKACPEVNRDLNNVYKTAPLKERAVKIHQLFGIPMNCIFFVKNYSSENEMNGSMNDCILLTLKQILQCGDDFLNNYQSPDAAVQVSDD